MNHEVYIYCNDLKIHVRVPEALVTVTIGKHNKDERANVPEGLVQWPEPADE